MDHLPHGLFLSWVSVAQVTSWVLQGGFLPCYCFWVFGIRKLVYLGALESCVTFVGTLTMLPFVPGAWHSGASGFRAMTIVSAFLLKDLVLLVVSVYLLRQDVSRVVSSRDASNLESGVLQGSCCVSRVFKLLFSLPAAPSLG